MTLGDHRSAPGKSTLGTQVGYGLRRSVTGTGRRWLLAAVLLTGLVFAVLVAVVAPVSSVAAVASPVGLLMSVLVPLCGVLLAQEFAHGKGNARAAVSLMVAAAIYAAAIAVAGFVFCVAAAAIVPSAAVGSPSLVVSAALGGIGLQVTAQLVGTGLGFLLRTPLVAFLGTIVFPLGVWFLLGLLGPFSWLRQWLTPFGATGPLTSGSASGIDVLAWAAVFVLWGVLLNAVGVARHGRGPTPTSSG